MASWSQPVEVLERTAKMGIITNETLINHLHCRRKAFLKAAGTPGELHDIERVRSDLDGAYIQRALEVYLARYVEREIVRSPPSLEAAIRFGPRIIVDATAAAGNVRSLIQLMERVEDGGGKGIPSYVPVMFVRNDKITQRDKLLLAFQAHALASVLGALPAQARIVHGEEYRALRVRIEPLVGQVRGLIEQIEADLRRDSPPTLTLNGHCNECEFRGACRGIAEATDDLSLLRGLSGKEIEKLRGRGIATVAQLSHTYRPGRRGKRRAGAARKHDPALQALALREQKVFVLDRPPMPVPRVALYLDVEGVPDRDFYYLIGLLAVEEGRSTSYSFWADDPTQEKAIWRACAEIIEGFQDYTVYHYGQYEQGFLDRMKQSANDGRGSGDRSHPVQVVQRPGGDLLALLLPDPLEQPEGHRQAPGLRVVRRGRFGNPEPGMAAGLGVEPRRGRSSSSCCCTTRRTAWRFAAGHGVRPLRRANDRPTGPAGRASPSHPPRT